MKIGWVGIGRMGLPMVNRLLDASYQLEVWNRTREKAAPLAQRGVTIVDKIADLREADAVFTMLSAKTCSPSASTRVGSRRGALRSGLRSS
jgi:3-hydroxyisobutyrate dehydrogenase